MLTLCKVPELMNTNSSGGRFSKDYGTPLSIYDDHNPKPFEEVRPVGPEEIHNDEYLSGTLKTNLHEPFGGRDEKARPNSKSQPSPQVKLRQTQQVGAEAPYGSSPSERSTTGTPFLRVPSRPRKPLSTSPHPSPENSQVDLTNKSDSDSEDTRGRPLLGRSQLNRLNSRPSKSDDSLQTEHDQRDNSLQSRPNEPKTYITVGVSRLHVVELPTLRVSETNVFAMHAG